MVAQTANTASNAINAVTRTIDGTFIFSSPLKKLDRFQHLANAKALFQLPMFGGLAQRESKTGPCATHHHLTISRVAQYWKCGILARAFLTRSQEGRSKNADLISRKHRETRSAFITNPYYYIPFSILVQIRTPLAAGKSKPHRKSVGLKSFGCAVISTSGARTRSVYE